MTGLLPHWSETIREWAESEPLILEAWAYGSRVKGGYGPDSDLDVAVRVDGADAGEALGNAIYEKGRWQRELQDRLPVRLHLDAMFPDDAVVWPAVQEHGMLLFRRH